MRVVRVAVGGLALAIVAGAGGITAVGASRHASFTSKLQALEHEWTADEAAGVPPESIAPLRRTLSDSSASSGWWAPYWWSNTGDAVLSSLEQRTAAVWSAALAATRSQAQAQLSGWADLEQRLGGYVPHSDAVIAETWPAQLAAARTPNAYAALAREWAMLVQQATTAAQSAQQTAQLNAEVAGAGGVPGLLASAQKAVSTADSLNLDPGTVPQLIGTLRSEMAANMNATATIRSLISSLASLRSLISYNDTVAAGFRPVMMLVDQAVAQGDGDARTLQTQYRTAQAALQAATQMSALQAVQAQLTQLQGAVATSLAADRCGHDVGSGKVITVNLTVQEIVFYQDGCVVQAAPVTTGRAQLRTPTGTFHIFYKQSPFEFISPWPPSSPFYYYPSWTSWVMEFDAGGYFIHDAPWEPNWQFGPGSEDSSGASHGCIHVPSTVMQWAYSWTPTGTPVIVSY